MPDSPEHVPAVTRLLQEWRDGRQDALERLMPLVCDELRVLASRHMAREWRVSMYQTTALVSEAYVKLVGQRDVDWQNRAHFFAIASTLMRRILVDQARHELRAKRGAGRTPAALEAAGDVVAPSVGQVDQVDVLDLDRALQRLAALDPDQARVVELRFFGGLTVEETASVTGVSPATVKREWALAKGWLYRELSGGRDS